MAAAPVERHEPVHADPGRDRQREAEDERIPVGCECFAREGEKTDTADVGPEDRESAQPPGQVPAGHRKPLDRLAPPLKIKADAQRRREIAGENKHIEGGKMMGHGAD